jgi:hypothetical protein
MTPALLRAGGDQMTSMQVLGGLHRFVRMERTMEFVRLGWLPLPSLVGTHHGDKVHVVWLCCCGAKEPDPRAGREAARMTLRAQQEQRFRHCQLAFGRGWR